MTHGSRKTPHIAMVAGALLALAVMFILWFNLGADKGAAVIGGTLLNMAVFGAMFSYIMQALSFIQLRKKFPDLHRPYRSPFGVPGASADRGDRRRDAVFPADRPGLPAGRDVGGHLV